MLELQNIGYAVEEGNTRKEILKNISLKIDDRFVAITGPNGGGKVAPRKLLQALISRQAVRFYWMVKILQIYPLRSVRIKESVLHFSSRFVLRD